MAVTLSPYSFLDGGVLVVAVVRGTRDGACRGMAIIVNESLWKRCKHRATCQQRRSPPCVIYYTVYAFSGDGFFSKNAVGSVATLELTITLFKLRTVSSR